ncbi:MAG TPA: 4,5-DOPA dioxygenase extradiol [Rhodanobacteraceae bacterium]|nr:4,5-DOPA dioxygenase extradiol [Rhodanobacteraceae bacterium]
MPVLFVGHGSPMNAIEDNPWRRQWQHLGEALPRPRAVLCVSAHWETRGVAVAASPNPATIHDFYGFPPELFAVEYPAPGAPDLAREIAQRIGDDAIPVQLDPQRGIDHGAWSVLCAMYPDADVPVLQLSLDTRQPGEWHYALAKRLAYLRGESVLVLGSGNIVHNLPLLARWWDAPSPPDWAERFRDRVNTLVAARDHAALCDWHSLGPDAGLAIPTPEHYLPLLYALALQRDDDVVETFNDDVFATLSMTSLLIGSHA